MREKINIPYHEMRNGFKNQVRNSSLRRGMNPLLFLMKKAKNHILQLLALYCPINSLRVKMHRLRGVNIGENVFIGLNCVLDHAYPEYIYLEDGCALNGDVYIIAHTNPNKSYQDYFEAYVAPVVIGKHAWIGIRSTILPGVRVGENSVVSAGVVVSKDVQPDTLVASAKNRIIKYR